MAKKRNMFRPGGAHGGKKLRVPVPVKIHNIRRFHSIEEAGRAIDMKSAGLATGK